MSDVRTPVTIALAPDPVRAIQIEQLRFAWRTAPTLLDIDHFSIARGERVFLQGASGSGKSTLLGLLAGVLLPQHGTVRVLGEELSALRAAQRDRFRADHIGFVFQMFNLLPFLSVRENIQLTCRFSVQRRQRVLDYATLDTECKRLLSALDLDPVAIADKAVADLSIGQQQRVAAARALIGAPELVIADEPTSALDADARAAFLNLLFAECARAHTTLVFVSHDNSLASRFDRHIKLADINRAVRVQAA